MTAHILRRTPVPIAPPVNVQDCLSRVSSLFTCGCLLYSGRLSEASPGPRCGVGLLHPNRKYAYEPEGRGGFRELRNTHVQSFRGKSTLSLPYRIRGDGSSLPRCCCQSGACTTPHPRHEWLGSEGVRVSLMLIQELEWPSGQNRHLHFEQRTYSSGAKSAPGCTRSWPGRRMAATIEESRQGCLRSSSEAGYGVRIVALSANLAVCSLKVGYIMLWLTWRDCIASRVSRDS